MADMTHHDTQPDPETPFDHERFADDDLALRGAYDGAPA
jgi:hypothetical protein